MSLVAIEGSSTTGTCCSHYLPPCLPKDGTVIVVIRTNVNANGRLMAKANDIVIGSCGHTGIIQAATASKITYIGGQPVALAGLTTFSGEYSGTIITGANTVFSV